MILRVLLPKRSLARAAVAGVLSGLFLGLFLKAIELWTSLKVYTLLLNIDYIPYLNQYKFPESIEFGFHVIISVLLSIMLVVYFHRKKVSVGTQPLFVGLVGLVVGVLLYPTTALSTRTPELTNLAALLFWLIGHVLYGLILGLLLRKRYV